MKLGDVMHAEQQSTMLKSEIFVEHPITIENAIKLKVLFEGEYVAGGTLHQIQWESGVPLPSRLINLSCIEQLKKVRYEKNDENILAIGALTSIAECITHPEIVEHCPLLTEACRNIAAPAVRNRATIGGNVASGIGDAIPALLVLDAKVKIALKDQIYVIDLATWLKEKGSYPFLLLDILIPLQAKKTKSFYRKVGRREAFTASLVTVSCCWSKCGHNENSFIRIAVGGGTHFPIRLQKLEKLLTGSRSQITRDIIYNTILEEFHSYSDAFVTESYRKKVTANILTEKLETILREG
ncbi:FAD binding domain-containing protein [Metabacillus litoralis]|uniref:FAD binding domain-containing protein n=2 Tax=Bacillaceae TaxID=186817 RepID=UPI00203EB60D|nr:FAD binding domain-containing protein [Metabacillus litoralis]MCM3410571.1 FAD binding domain-containing protein [Metabacillus litoralis]